MTIDAADSVALHAVRLGDRHRTARGWLVVAHGAVRAVMSATPDGRILHACACDRRVLPADGLMLLEDLEEAQAWLELRLPSEPPRSKSLCRGTSGRRKTVHHTGNWWPATASGHFRPT